MGLFNKLIYGNPNKPDLQVEDNPNPIKSFFEILKLKLWDLVKLNLLFLVFMLPAIIWTGINLSVINNQFVAAEIQTLNADALAQAGVFQTLGMYFLGMIPCFVIMGVALPSLNYITRSYAREFHVWMMDDFVEKIKENWKQSLIYMLIFGIIVFAMYYSILFYSFSGGMIPMAGLLKGLVIAMLIFLLLSTTFVYPAMVTFELKFRQLIKNSFILTIAKLPQTLLMLVLVGVLPVFLLWLAISWQYGMLVFLGYNAIFGFSFTSFVINSYTNQVFEKIIVANGEKEANKKPETSHKEDK